MAQKHKNSHTIRRKEAEIFASLLTEEGKKALLSVLLAGGSRTDAGEGEKGGKESFAATRDASLSRARVRARTRKTVPYDGIWYEQLVIPLEEEKEARRKKGAQKKENTTPARNRPRK